MLAYPQKNIVIVGATGGIGSPAALIAHELGANVYLSYSTNKEKAGELPI